VASIISPCVSSINTGFFSSVFLRHGCQSLLMIRRMTSMLTRYDFRARQSTEYISTRLFLASCIPSHQSMYPPVISITTVSSASPRNDKPPSRCPLVCFLPSYVFFIFVCFPFIRFLFARIFHHCRLKDSTMTKLSSYHLCALH
jgi:hypothetical protein